MPQVTLRTGFEVNGQEEVLQEYLCDWPACPNSAVHVLGIIKELGLRSVLCEEHASRLQRRKHTPGSEAA